MMTPKEHKIKSGLYSIRIWVRGLCPLYISLCAALLIDLKSNMKLDLSSIFYFLGLFMYIYAVSIAHILSDRCDWYRKIYDIRLSQWNAEKRQHQDSAKKPSPIDIYIEKENKNEKNKELSKYKKRRRKFQYYSVFISGILGLISILISYCCFDNQPHKIYNKNIELQGQVDLLKGISNKQIFQISELKHANDSILKLIEQQNKLDRIGDVK